MCLVVDSDKEFSVAENDIKCYKVVLGNWTNSNFAKYSTPYQYMSVCIGEHYKASEEPDFRYYYKDFSRDIWPKMLRGGAYHSFLTLEDAIVEAEYVDKYNNPWAQDVHVVECTIPAGAKYIEGTYENYGNREVPSIASTEIIYNAVVESHVIEAKLNEV